VGNWFELHTSGFYFSKSVRELLGRVFNLYQAFWLLCLNSTIFLSVKYSKPHSCKFQIVKLICFAINKKAHVDTAVPLKCIYFPISTILTIEEASVSQFLREQGAVWFACKRFAILST
jgi:hypothetical protein